MKTRFLIIIGILLMIAFSIFFTVFYTFDNNSTYNVLDVEVNVVGIKSNYTIGEPVSFSVHVNSLGNIVPWPTLRIYQDYVDISSKPVYSRMYMTPIESGDKQKSLEWRDRTWNFPLESDIPIRFSNNGNYTLRVDVDAKKHVLINFQVVNSTNNSEIIDDGINNKWKEYDSSVSQCLSFFHCDASAQNFEQCISGKKDGITIEQLCSDSKVTTDAGCTTIEFPDDTTIIRCG
ncbi:hypothetical protein [Nitrosopumilus sp.]|uniref:hypothetical protein n=1 Tax=Nitrosopumilus sp. TaxID=2024843 RepID=UPI00247E3247|nr:hypothetical protein [Nitrosopumilus sp.]MCV0409624.1 hypothetical protein [Nitrosopumilus sp.]